MAQNLSMSARVTNNTKNPPQKHGSNALILPIGDLEEGALIDVDEAPLPAIAIPGDFTSKGVIVLIDETQGVVTPGEFVQFGFASAVYVGQLTVGVAAVFELDQSVTELYLVRNAVGTSKIRYHFFDGG